MSLHKSTNTKDDCKKCNSALESDFIDLLHKYNRMIYKICMTFSNKNVEKVKDLYQEVVINLWKSYPTYDSTKSESSWVYRVAFNSVVSQYRVTPRNISFVDYPQDIEKCMAQDMEDPLIEELYTLISKLTPQEQALAYLYIDGYKESDIAEMLEISISSVGVKIHRLKQKLKHIYENNGF